jgi:endonuclease YncB( thermonuclease family)
MGIRSLTSICILLLIASAQLALADTRRPIICRSLTAVDGDTIKCDGVNMRHMGDGAPFVSGYDTPEIRNSKCAAEKALGQQAKKRMAQLLKIPGVKIYDSGEDDGRYRPPCMGRAAGWPQRRECPDRRRFGSPVDSGIRGQLVPVI